MGVFGLWEMSKIDIGYYLYDLEFFIYSYFTCVYNGRERNGNVLRVIITIK